MEPGWSLGQVCPGVHPHLLTFNLGVTGLNRTKTHCKRSQGTGCNWGEMHLQMSLFDLQNIGNHARVLHLPVCVPWSVTENYQRPTGSQQDIAISSPVRSPQALNQSLGEAGSFTRHMHVCVCSWVYSHLCFLATVLQSQPPSACVSYLPLLPLPVHALLLSENPSIHDDDLDP